MKKYGKLHYYSILIGVFLSALSFLLYLCYGEDEVRAQGSVPTYLKFPGFDPEAPTGSNQNPFIILEIVPYRGMGQIGYLVGGQEPVDINKSTYARPLWGPINSIAQGAFEVVHKEQLDEEDIASEWVWRQAGRYYEPANLWKFKNKEIFKRNILHLSEEQLETYQIRVITITPDELKKNVEKFSKYYDLSANGAYRKVKSEAQDEDEIDLIGNADLISISPKAHAGNTVIDLWETYGRDTSGKSTSSGRYHYDFASNDLNWQTTLELFMKIGVVEERAPFVYDITCITSPPGTSNASRGLVSSETSPGYLNHVYKLCLMLRQQDPVQFYNQYLNTNGGELTAKISTKVLSGGTTGSFDVTVDANSRIYWSEYTFLPFYPDGTKPPYIAHTNYKNYLNNHGFLVNWIAGNCHDAVIRNTYSYNGTSSIVQYFLTSLDIKENTYTSYDYNKEFFDYLEERIRPRPVAATPLQAVEYILGYEYSPVSPSRELRILELQPCNDFSLSVNKIREILPNLLGNIRITQQTTAEFIGKMEDLNCSYDMIYIGTNTGTMNTDSYGKPIYNDPTLDGFIYLHVGDRVIGYDNLKGILKDSTGNRIKAASSLNVSTTSQYQSKILKGYSSGALSSADFYRYSGNDITTIKRIALQEFVDAGNIVLLEDSLYHHNRNIIDDSSHLYYFLSDNHLRSPMINKKELSQLSTFQAIRNKIQNQLDKNKLSIGVTKYPKEYDDTDPTSRIVDRTLTFEFMIYPPDGAGSEDWYQWTVYVDLNADGNFTIEESIDRGQAKAGHEVTSIRTLNEDYADVVPWKLKVQKVGEPVIRTEKSGFAAFRNTPLSETEAERTQIDVLQITSNSSTVHLEELMNPRSGKTSLFYQYTKDLNDFNIKIKTITVNEFLEWYSTSGKRYDKNNHESTDKLYLMKNGVKKPYDMLIFGFGDCYSDINNHYGALDNIQAYIDSGKSVMFTHDTTSFVNLSESEYSSYANGLTFWGYGINQYLRNRMGLDRFGVMKEVGDTTPYDKATMPSQVDRTLYKSNELTRNRTTYPEIQGITYPILVGFQNPGAKLAIYNANKNYPPYKTTGNQIVNGNAISNYQLNESYVTKVNQGQITTYPYQIPDRFQVAKTHAQYYQLNMDDPEIKVWYCLSDAVAGEVGPYSSSPNDVRNNYYIFSKKNVMYTVVGHSTIDAIRNVGTAPSYDANEVKLFINTMIASYQAGVTGPEVVITNSDAMINDSGDYILYENASLPAAYVKKITFKTIDSNLSTVQLAVRIYYYDSEGVCSDHTEDLVIKNALNHSMAIRFTDSNGPVFYVEPEKEYYFYLTNASMDDFEIEGKDGFYIEVANEEYHLRSGKKVFLLERLLFDLD